VESRPTGAGPEWLDGAVERIVFRPEDFPRAGNHVRDALPYTEYYGPDGWPIHCPERVKPKLDQRMKAEFHRFPWTCRPERWSDACWLGAASNYDDFERWNRQAGVIRGPLRSAGLPVPNSST
jgi:hypothetical protein